MSSTPHDVDARFCTTRWSVTGWPPAEWTLLDLDDGDRYDVAARAAEVKP